MAEQVPLRDIEMRFATLFLLFLGGGFCRSVEDGLGCHLVAVEGEKGRGPRGTLACDAVALERVLGLDATALPRQIQPQLGIRAGIELLTLQEVGDGVRELTGREPYIGATFESPCQLWVDPEGYLKVSEGALEVAMEDIIDIIVNKNLKFLRVYTQLANCATHRRFP